MDKHDFDALVALRESNPEEFERHARKLIEDEIIKARPEFQARLRGLQFRVDAVLSRCKNPVVRYNKMVELFWIGVQELHDALKGKKHRAASNMFGSVIPFYKKDT